MATIPKTAKLTRPDPGQPAVAVTLTATITKDTEVIEQAFTLNVEPLSSDEVVSNVYNQLTEATILKGNTSVANILTDLELPTTGANGSTITWTSSTPTFLTNAGVVTRPSYTQGDVNITLEATVTSGTIASKKTFNVTVIKLGQTVTEYLESVWTSAQSTILNGNIDASHVTTALAIPTISGVAVSMTSSVPATITNTGAVTQPISTAANIPVTLTFTLVKDTTTITKTLACIVLHQ